MTPPNPVVLCILDGWGLSDRVDGNAVYHAATPNFDRILGKFPHARLATHGLNVGLPDGQMGNSEVGHTNIGAGRTVAMDLGRIDLAIQDGSFASNPALGEFVETLRRHGGTAHLLGLVSDGGVHGHVAHIEAAVQTIAETGIPVVLHAMTDGRDVAPSSALAYLDRLTAHLPQSTRIGTVCGRYFAMDRDNRWDRVARAFGAMVHGFGKTACDARSAVIDAYARGETDEFIQPVTIGDYRGMSDGDGIFCLNFRADRVRQLLAAIGEPGFDHFNTASRPRLSTRLGMVKYSVTHNDYMTAVFPKTEIVNTLGEWVAGHGLRQFRLAETEKYPHVTFFLNGGREEPVVGEDRFMAPSPKVATYDLLPEMAAGAVTARLAKAILSDYHLVVVNYANPDMVGHTGNFDAAIRACEAVDAGLGYALDALNQARGTMIVTADHGNCETMIDPVTGGPHTAHTLNPVPVALIGGRQCVHLRNGRLADIAPTVLELMGIATPPEMTGRSLIET